jgi:hypothetical protein
MVALNVMFTYNMAIRRGEANQGGKGTEDHTIRNEDLTFHLRSPIIVNGVEVYDIRGGSQEFRRNVVASNVERCTVQAITQ